MLKFNIHVPGRGHCVGPCYGHSKRDALNAFRGQWYPERNRLPRGTVAWLS